MIFYNPTDGTAKTTPQDTKPKHCFLMTRLGEPIDDEVLDMRSAIGRVCEKNEYSLVDASSQITGKDFLLKIWSMIAATPLSIGICHESIPAKTQANIFYELGVAQAMGKETLLVKSAQAEVPSDFVRTEYLTFNDSFEELLDKYFKENLMEMAGYYETVSDQLENNPVLAIDYLKRAYLISGEPELRGKVKQILDDQSLKNRAKNSVELMAANF